MMIYLIVALLFAKTSHAGVLAAACTADAKECPDGSYVGRDATNNCEFKPCPPVAPIACTKDAKECPDGSYVSRDATNNCEFEPCPPVACTEDAKVCPDGTAVGRDSNNNCEFFPCIPIPIDCSLVNCLAPNCAKDEELYVSPGECCPKCAKEGKECGKQGTSVCPGGLRAKSSSCPDGITCYDNCGTCAYQINTQTGKLECSPYMIPKDSVCPDLDCSLVRCAYIDCSLVGQEAYTPVGGCCQKCRPIPCTKDAKLCPDGTTVSRDSNNNCEFFPCPPLDCRTVLCPAINCKPKQIKYTPEGECCPQCENDCNLVPCSPPPCTPDEEMFKVEGSCCEICKPKNSCPKGERICPDGTIIERGPNNPCKFPSCSDGSKGCPRGQCRNGNGGCGRGSYVQCLKDPCQIDNGGCGAGICTANYCNGCNAVCSCNGKYECVDGTGDCVKGSIVNCFVDPCMINNGGCKTGQLCQSNYCNGCNAICSKCPVGNGYCFDSLGDCVTGDYLKTFSNPCDRFNGGCGKGETCTANYCNGANAVCTDPCDIANNRCANPDGICAGIVQCKVDPCSINNGGCQKGETCTANYCGGCNAVCS